MKTVTGSCHCGTVVFEVDLDDGFQDLTRCNCSLCRRRGAIMASVPLERLRVVKGGDELTLYQWNEKIARHYFCSRCGVYTHHQQRSDPSAFSFNVACIEGVDPYELEGVGISDGASLPLA